MSADAKASQADEDGRTQDRLTRSVGIRLERSEKSTTTPWGTLKRLLRIG
jgi:hypothetical protein